MTDEELIALVEAGQHDEAIVALENLEPIDAAATAVRVYQYVSNYRSIDEANEFSRELNVASG